jgi:hypothetical protein
MTGGGGGALLGIGAEWDDVIARAARWLGSAGAGVRDLCAAAAQWALGRPALYGVPSAIPGLKLGEMVYHPAHEPRAISTGAAALVRDALALAERELVTRRRHAAALAAAAAESDTVRAIRPIVNGASGFLRFPVLDTNARVPRPALGVLRGYPRTLFEQEELRPSLWEDERELPGALELRRSLFTLPTHGRLSLRDLHELRVWIRGDAAHAPAPFAAVDA